MSHPPAHAFLFCGSRRGASFRGCGLRLEISRGRVVLRRTPGNLFPSSPYVQSDPALRRTLPRTTCVAPAFYNSCGLRLAACGLRLLRLESTRCRSFWCAGESRKLSHTRLSPRSGPRKLTRTRICAHARIGGSSSWWASGSCAATLIRRKLTCIT